MKKRNISPIERDLVIGINKCSNKKRNTCSEQFPCVDCSEDIGVLKGIEMEQNRIIEIIRDWHCKDELYTEESCIIIDKILTKIKQGANTK